MYDPNEWKRNRYHEWRDQGLCGKCGKRWAEAGRAKCRVCRLAAQKSARRPGAKEALNEYKRKQKEERRAKGLCTNCGKPLKEEERGRFKSCERCRKMARERTNVQRHKMRIHGIKRKRYKKKEA